MSIFFVPALISLLFKAVILSYVLRGGRVSIIFLSLIVVFAIHNTIEFIGYFYLQNNQMVEILFRLYYVATTYVILYMLLHALSVSKLENKASVTALITIATALSGLMLFSDQVITGLYSIGYTVSALKGPHYWSFATFILISLCSSFGVLVYGYRTAQSQIDSVRCMHSMLALSPMLLVCAAAIIFKIADININATGLIPIATTLFLIIVVNTESKHKLSDLRRIMPLSAERETTNNLMDLLDNYIQNGNQSNVYKELQEGIEKEIIMYSLKKCDNNITYTAKMMGLKNRSTLYSMINRLDIDLKQVKQNAMD